MIAKMIITISSVKSSFFLCSECGVGGGNGRGSCLSAFLSRFSAHNVQPNVFGPQRCKRCTSLNMNEVGSDRTTRHGAYYYYHTNNNSSVRLLLQLPKNSDDKGAQIDTERFQN